MAGHKPQKLTLQKAEEMGITFKKKKIKEGNTVYFKPGTKKKINKTGFFDFFTVFR
jgi:hypothetical protein